MKFTKNSYSKGGKGGFGLKKSKNRSDRGIQQNRSPVRLPNLKSAYLQHPAEGMNMKRMKPPIGKKKNMLN